MDLETRRAPIQVGLLELWAIDQTVADHQFSYIAETLGGGDLKEQMRDAIVFCYDNQQGQATLLLTEDHVRLLDIAIDPNHSVGEINVGRPLLLKAFRAGKELREGKHQMAEEPFDLSRPQTKLGLMFWDPTEDASE